MYHATTGLSCFAEALVALKKGTKVCRRGWNGAGQYVALCTDWNGALGTLRPDYELIPFFYIHTAQAKIASWVPSSTDLLAEDWEPAILPWEQNGPTHGPIVAGLAQDDLLPGYHTTVTDWAAA